MDRPSLRWSGATPTPRYAASTCATVPIAWSAPAAAAPAPAATLTVATRGLTVAAVPAPPVVAVDATMITVSHWGRLEEGALFAWSRRLEWAVMMKRTFGFSIRHEPLNL